MSYPTANHVNDAWAVCSYAMSAMRWRKLVNDALSAGTYMTKPPVVNWNDAVGHNGVRPRPIRRQQPRANQSLSAGKGTTTAPGLIEPGYYKRCFPGGCTQSVLEAHGGGGATHSDRSHRFTPGNKEKQNARTTDNSSS